jgi:hypothetical protein
MSDFLTPSLESNNRSTHIRVSKTSTAILTSPSSLQTLVGLNCSALRWGCSWSNLTQAITQAVQNLYDPHDGGFLEITPEIVFSSSFCRTPCPYVRPTCIASSKCDVVLSENKREGRGLRDEPHAVRSFVERYSTALLQRGRYLPSQLDMSLQ